MQKDQNALGSVVIRGTWTAAPNGSGPVGTYDNTNYYNPSDPAGVTGQLDNSQLNNSPSSTGWGGTTNRPQGDTYGWNQCKNVYCHSLGRKPSSMTAGDNNHYRQDVKWNTGTQHCNDCHGRGTDNVANGGINWGMPNYTGGTVGSDNANSHAPHVINNRYECSVCHFVTVAGTGGNRTILASPVPSNHVNGVREVVFDGTNATGTYSDTPATKTCVVSCHGNNPLRWGGPPQNCDSCHVRVGDVDDFGTGTQPSMSRNGITAGIDNNEWNWSGHGKDTGNYDVSGNPAANLLAGSTGTNKCAYCHNPAIAHDNTTNPFRLANFDTFSQGWNGACYVCHAGVAVGNSAPGYAPAADNAGSYAAKTATRKVANNHYNPGNTSNARHSSTYNGGAFCYDCHDPHGDRSSIPSGNVFMIGKRVSMRTDNAAGTGIPVGGNDNSNRPTATFTNNVSGLDYASTDNVAPFDGICETCHESASGILHYTRAGRLDSTHFTTKCVVCHTHDGGFRGLGGPDVGQYFDRSIQAPGPSNFADNSSHPLRGLTTTDNSLLYGGQNCLGCHYASGPSKAGDECLKCHFEAQPNAPAGNHMDKTLQLATVNGNSLPTGQFAISTIQDYDNWCLQCHSSTTITLGGQSVSGRTYFPNPGGASDYNTASGFTNGRHRANQVGCIYCHAPHGSGNARLVRINPANRGSAGPTPREFGVFPTDNTGSYTGSFAASPNEVRPYRARVDNVAPNIFADADDENSFCNKACHVAKTSNNFVKDKMIKRDGVTGNYLLSPGNKKTYLINGGEYTNDNISTFFSNPHVHPNGDIITTDNMVRDYANLIGLTGPNYYQYPLPGGTANPGAYTVTQNGASPLPFSPDYVDGTRDFTNAWNNLGVAIKYRYTCSTCHNPHGTTEPNTSAGEGYPDLRLRKMNPNTLCNRCHK